MRRMSRFIDDILVVAGCGCVLYGMAQFSPILAWIVGGIMLIGAGLAIGKAMSK